MKSKIKKWTLRSVVTLVFLASVLLTIILHPRITYAHETKCNGYTVFHNAPLDKEVPLIVMQSQNLVSQSELYTPSIHIDICLNDGSIYPKLIEVIGGRAFARGFYNKVVLLSKADYKNNFSSLNGYKWNLTQLLAHEMVHCYQFDKFGFWKSNPFAQIKNWKWEGYPEYVARQMPDQKSLFRNIQRLQSNRLGHDGWIHFGDSTGTVIDYYKNWLLIQYCLEEKKMSYKEIIEDTTDQQIINSQMMGWYKKKMKR